MMLHEWVHVAITCISCTMPGRGLTDVSPDVLMELGISHMSIRPRLRVSTFPQCTNPPGSLACQSFICSPCCKRYASAARSRER